MAQHNILGIEGEAAAIHYLMEAGYTLHQRNWRSGHHEIDIVAEWYGLYVFIEVKSRSNTDFGEPEKAVNETKIKHLANAASHYMRYYRLDNPVRFDIITLVGQAEPFRLHHFVDAFRAPSNHLHTKEK